MFMIYIPEPGIHVYNCMPPSSICFIPVGVQQLLLPGVQIGGIDAGDVAAPLEYKHYGE